MIIGGVPLNIDDLVGLWVEKEQGNFLEISSIRLITNDHSSSVPSSIGDSVKHPYRLDGSYRTEEVEAEVYYRKDDTYGKRLDREKCAGPRSFLKRYVQLGGSIDTLATKYERVFGEKLPMPRPLKK